MGRKRITAAGGLLAALALASPVFAANALHGKELFTACVACHTEGPDAPGPSLKGVMGRKSGALEDFRYSAAMMRSNIGWDEENLRNYLRDPQAVVKGNHMPFSGFTNPDDANDVVAYLRTYR